MPKKGHAEKALLAPERIEQIVAYVREHFDQKTKRNSTYALSGRRLAGFNSLFATASIDGRSGITTRSPTGRTSCPLISG